MRSEAVIFGDISPVGINHCRTLTSRSDTVTPVILIGKASPGPSQVRDLNFFESINNIEPYTILFGNLHAFAHPITIIYTSSEMFGEMAINMPAYCIFRRTGINQQCY